MISRHDFLDCGVFACLFVTELTLLSVQRLMHSGLQTKTYQTDDDKSELVNGEFGDFSQKANLTRNNNNII